jgi:hypothetical protein
MNSQNNPPLSSKVSQVHVDLLLVHNKAIICRVAFVFVLDCSVRDILQVCMSIAVGSCDAHPLIALVVYKIRQ